MALASVPGFSFTHTQPDWQPQQVRKSGVSAKKLLKSSRPIAVILRCEFFGRSSSTPVILRSRVAPRLMRLIVRPTTLSVP